MRRTNKILVVALALIMVLAAITGCGKKEKTEEKKADEPKTEEKAEEKEEKAEEKEEKTSDGKKIEIGVLIKGTDSDFWQQVLVGAYNFGVDHPDVNITEYGPTSEADSAEQTEILDNLITTKPDGIAIAPTLMDNCSAGIDNAMSQGIPVAVIDNKPSTDNYVAMYATDAYAAGGLVAEKFVGELEARGIALEGFVGLVSPMAGQDTVMKREAGFIDKLKEIAPDITVGEPQYTDNDIPKSLSTAEDIYTANKDTIVGYFAANNATGSGLAGFMTELMASNPEAAKGIVAVAFDSDQAEVDAVKAGALYCIAIQNPYEMGYQACQAVYDVITGAKKVDDFEAFYDTGVSLVDKENVEDPDMQGIIDPFTLKKY
ncbi:MAG TPA: substrate-binding domain-containing protein [Clostridiaceae bacterium]|nr:substrate-binding domain-containing protein [Clostridiaceae bacterium]